MVLGCLQRSCKTDVAPVRRNAEPAAGGPGRASARPAAGPGRRKRQGPFAARRASALPKSAESFLGRNPEMDVVWGSVLHRRNRRWRGADYSTIVRSEYVSAGLDRSDRSSDDALMHVADTAVPLC